MAATVHAIGGGAGVKTHTFELATIGGEGTVEGISKKWGLLPRGPGKHEVPDKGKVTVSIHANEGWETDLVLLDGDLQTVRQDGVYVISPIDQDTSFGIRFVEKKKKVEKPSAPTHVTPANITAPAQAPWWKKAMFWKKQNSTTSHSSAGLTPEEATELAMLKASSGGSSGFDFKLFLLAVIILAVIASITYLAKLEDLKQTRVAGQAIARSTQQEATAPNPPAMVLGTTTSGTCRLQGSKLFTNGNFNIYGGEVKCFQSVPSRSWAFFKGEFIVTEGNGYYLEEDCSSWEPRQNTELYVSVGQHLKGCFRFASASGATLTSNS